MADRKEPSTRSSKRDTTPAASSTTAENEDELLAPTPLGETHRGAFGEFGGESGGLIERTFRERIVLVGVTRPGSSDEDTDASLDELSLLVDTAGADAVARLTQRRQSPDPATYVGKGKVQEIKDENSDPFRLVEPGGILDVSNARYDDVDGRVVAVSGSVFEPRPYTMKLEGAAGGAFQTVMLVGIKDPAVLAEVDRFVAQMHHILTGRVVAAMGDKAGRFDISLRAYGWNA